MPRTMYDSVTCTDIPESAQMVAGYVDGIYAWSDACWQRFPGARKVTITVTGATLDANVADCENGDLNPAQAAAWLKRKVERDGYGVLYFSRSLFGQVDAARKAQGVGDGQWGVWVADWTGTPHYLPGSIATQYADPAYGSGGHYDLSVVADYWPGVDPAPGPAAAPGPVPVPPPPPTAGAAGTNLDQARAAWANLGILLTQVVPDLIIRLDQAVSDLRKL